jgi:hypothetical protein
MSEDAIQGYGPSWGFDEQTGHGQDHPAILTLFFWVQNRWILDLSRLSSLKSRQIGISWSTATP